MIGQNVERLAALARKGPAVRIVREPVQRLLARQVFDVVQAATAAAAISGFAHKLVFARRAENLGEVALRLRHHFIICASQTSRRASSFLLCRRAPQARASSEASFESHQPFTTPLKLAKVRRSLASGTPKASRNGVSKSATDKHTVQRLHMTEIAADHARVLLERDQAAPQGCRLPCPRTDQARETPC